MPLNIRREETRGPDQDWEWTFVIVRTRPDSPVEVFLHPLSHEVVSQLYAANVGPPPAKGLDRETVLDQWVRLEPGLLNELRIRGLS